MTSASGSQHLVRLAAAYLTSIAFAVSFLVGIACGVDGMTALTRGVIAGALTLIAAHFLAPPVVEVVIAALVRDEARRQAEQGKEDDQ